MKLWVAFFVSAVGLLASLVTGMLIERHWISEELGQRLKNEALVHAVILAPLIAAAVLSAWKNVYQRKSILTALMPGIDTEDKLKAQMKSGVTPTLKTPSDTVPGVPDSAIQAEIKRIRETPPGTE